MLRTILVNNEYRISDGLSSPHIRTNYMIKNNDSSSLQSRSPTFGALVRNVWDYKTKNTEFCPFPDDCLAIHLRLGDFASLKSKSEYLALLDSVNKKVDENKNLRSLAVVTALNFAATGIFKYSKVKLENNIDILHAFIQGCPLPVQVHSSTPDEDFCKLATAKHLLISFGGYGELAQRVKGALAKCLTASRAEPQSGPLRRPEAEAEAEAGSSV